MTFVDIWTYLGPFAGALLVFIGNYFLEHRRNGREKEKHTQSVECTEIQNTRVFSREMLGPIGHSMGITVTEGHPTPMTVSISEIYVASYRFRSLSDKPVENLMIQRVTKLSSLWYSIHEGKGVKSPEWEHKLTNLMEDRVNEESQVSIAFIPYLNPFKTTGHEAYIDIASYMPLDIELLYGGTGIKPIVNKL